MANMNDSHFGEGFNDSAKVSDKQKRQLDADIKRINRQKEKDLARAERETDKSFVQSEKRRISGNNRFDVGKALWCCNISSCNVGK